MRKGPPHEITAELWDQILGLRQRAARMALRLGAGNLVGLTDDDLRALAEDGLMAAAGAFEPDRDTDLGALGHEYVRGRVLHALRAGRRRQSREVPASTIEAERARDRATLDDLGAGVDPDAYDLFEDTDGDFLQRARGLARDGMLAMILAALPSLPEDHARLIRLRFHEGKTLAEIAEATQTPRETVRRHLVEAVAMLKLRLADP